MQTVSQPQTTAQSHRPVRTRRALAYHLDAGYHGAAEYAAPGWYRWFPHPAHSGVLVEAAALRLGPGVHSQSRPS